MSSGEHKRAGDTGVRLGLALLAYMLTVTLIVTLLPFQFARPERVRVVLAGDALDIVANVVLFVPLGFLYCLVRRGKRALFSAIAAGAALSLAIEALQLLQASRTPTVLDLVANTFGAALGAAAFVHLARLPRVDGRVIDWLALELPLIALVYLLLPLLWLNTLAVRGESLRVAGTLLIGAFGAAIVGGIQRRYLGPSGAGRPYHAGAFVAIWFPAGAFALANSHPQALVGGALALAALAWWLARRPPPTPGPDRRFEGPLLKATIPLYAAYLLLIAIAPLSADAVSWRFHLGFPDRLTDQIEILRLIELGAAFTLVGYMAAEMRGRTAMRYRDAVWRLAAAGAALALSLETVHAGYALTGGSLVRGILLAAATVYGGGLYYLQRAHVMRHSAGIAREPLHLPR